MPRSHQPSYPEIEVWSTSSSTSVDSEDEWYTWRHDLRPQPNRHGVLVHHNPHHHHPHPHQHVQRLGAPINNVFPPAPPSYVSVATEPGRNRERRYYADNRRTRSAGRDSNRNVYLGGRPTFPNLFVDIHNQNSDNDHDHSRNRDYEATYGSDHRSPSSYPQPTYAPVSYGVPYGVPHSPGYAAGSLGQGRASVNDRMSLDHGEVMNQQVYVGPYDRDRQGRRYHYDDWFVDSRSPSMDITTVQQTAVDKYVHDLRIAKEAQDAAVRQAKLDDKEHAKEIEDVEDKAVRKYQDGQSEIKKKCDIAVFDYKKSEADKKAELDRAKAQWALDKAEAERKEKARKQEWEVAQAAEKKKRDDAEKALKDKWAADQAAAQKKKDDEEKALKDRIKAEEEKKQREAKEKKEKEEKEAKEKEEKIKKEVEIELLKRGFPPRAVESAVDPKARSAPEPVYEEWYRRYFQPWDEGGRRWIRVHRRYIMPDTLRVYQLDWDWDRDDDNYIIIKRDYDNPGIDLRILIEHTRKHGWSHSQSPHSKYAHSKHAYEVENLGWPRGLVLRRFKRWS